MADYKHILNLPNTDFPMKANLPRREPEVAKQWQALDIYGKLRAAGKGRDKFILHDGPPIALMAWGDRWLGGRRDATAVLYHTDCGRRLVPSARCNHCGGELGIDDVVFRRPAARPARQGG